MTVVRLGDAHLPALFDCHHPHMPRRVFGKHQVLVILNAGSRAQPESQQDQQRQQLQQERHAKPERGYEAYHERDEPDSRSYSPPPPSRPAVGQRQDIPPPSYEAATRPAPSAARQQEARPVRPSGPARPAAAEPDLLGSARPAPATAHTATPRSGAAPPPRPARAAPPPDHHVMRSLDVCTVFSAQIWNTAAPRLHHAMLPKRQFYMFTRQHLFLTACHVMCGSRRRICWALAAAAARQPPPLRQCPRTWTTFLAPQHPAVVPAPPQLLLPRATRT